MTTISRFKEINNTDAFDSFGWSASDFGKLNLIYGWNGSGKTTISRLSNFLERKNIHLPDFSEIDFNIVTSAGAVKKQDILTHTLDVRVFNEDFIRENLAFGESTAKKIVIVGKANIEAQREIDALEAERTEKRQELNAFTAQRSEIPKLDQILTEAGRAVTKQFGNTPLANHEYYGRSYNKGRVETKIADGTITDSNVISLIMDSQTQLDTYKDVIKNERKKISLSFSELSDFSNLFSTSNELLATVSRANDLGDLKNDQVLRDWTENGYRLHKERHSPSCLFCSQSLPSGLLERLGEFFTDELEQVKTRIDDNVFRLATISSSYVQSPLDSGTLFPDVAAEYLPTKSAVERISTEISTAIDTLVANLRKKKTTLHDNAKKFNAINYPATAVTYLNDKIKKAKMLVEKHNNRVETSAEEVTKAARAIEMHTIASILSSKDYFKKNKDAEELSSKTNLANTRLVELNRKIGLKKAVLQNAHTAMDRINSFLKEFFGDQQIYLEVIDPTGGEIGYILKSRGKNAKYLSEGEKSVLALIYFFIKLEEEGCDKKNCTIVIDDPVDSQDSNFLFRTFGLLKRQLGDSGQLIILTHNFDFFNLVRDWLVSTNQGKDSRLYLISLNKNGATRSVVVENLPEILKKFKSEYQYLFCRLHQYSLNTKPLDEPLVANVGRKVLEYFAGFKWSCKTTEQFTGIVLNRFVADPNHLKKGTGDFITKFLHEYSHGQDFSRSISAPMLESKAVAENILTFIRLADKEHYDVLVAMCGT